MTRKRSFYLGSTSMTAAERAKGRFMRAPDDHPTPAPAAGEPPADQPADLPAADPVVSFDDAFSSALAEGAEPAAPAAPPAPAAPAAPEPPAAPAPAAPAPAEPPAAPEPPKMPTAEEIVAGLAEKLGGTPPAAPAPAAPAPVEQAPLYNAEEQAVLANYQKDWPDVAKAEQLTRRAEYHDLLAFVFKEVNKFVSPVIDQVRQMGNTLHTGELKTLVPDYNPLVEADVNAWIDTQPSYLQAGMKGVMQGGTSDEVADLIGRYRAASGVAPAPAAPAAPAPAAPQPKAPKAPAAAPKTELSQAAKQAAESLAPVSGERSQVPVGEDQQDFDSAFAKYAAAGG